MAIFIAIFLTFVCTILGTVLVLNLRSGEKQIAYVVNHLFPVEDPRFLRSMGYLLGPGLLSGNKIVALQNGDAIFPAMLQAIRGAKRSITFETYIYWSGKIGKRFAEALSERAKAGVHVHVMLDWVGAGKMDAEYLARMRDSGVEVDYYHPLRWYNIARINNRTHRKLLVVDGAIGFTGGVGIADVWMGNADSPEHWRDSHFQLEGPAVAQMQSCFIDNWTKTRSVVLFGDDYFPELHAAGNSLAQVFRSSMGEGSESVRLMYLLSIASATKSIRLQASYFVPDDLAIKAFVAARERGVRVEIIVPGPIIDEHIVQHASRSLWGALLDSGVRIYEYQPTMYHCKVLIVDDIWVSVGSTNFDDRSFRLNDEANLNIYDATFACEQIAAFEDDKAHAKEITRAAFKERSAPRRFIENLAVILRRQL